MKLNDIEKNISKTSTNIIFINDSESVKLIDLEKLNESFLLLSNQKNKNLDTNLKVIKIPTSINNLESFIENLKINFHDIIIVNEKLINITNNSFCYLTKLESEILTRLIVEKESTKKHIQENILKIKSTIQTNSLDSHLTRIRKKLSQINTSVKIKSKNDKLVIIS